MVGLFETKRCGSALGNAFPKVLAKAISVTLVISGILGALTSFSSEIVSASGGWGPRVLISDDPNNDHWSYLGAVATDIHRNVYVVWEDLSELDGSGPDYDVYLKKWDFASQTWEPRVLVTDDNLNNVYSSVDSQVATDSNGNVHVVWRNNGDLGGDHDDSDIYWKMLDTDTNTWGPRVLISDEPDNDGTSWGAALAPDAFGNIHLVYEDWNDLSPNTGVQYRKWNGITRIWEPRMTVTTNSTGSWLIGVDTDPDGNVHVAWGDQADMYGAGADGWEYDIFYRKLDASSNTWGLIQWVNDDDPPTSSGSNMGDLTSDPFGNVYVFWDDVHSSGPNGTSGHNIFYRKLNAATGEWEPRVMISDDLENKWHSYGAQACSDLFGNVHVVWTDHTWPRGDGIPWLRTFYRKLDIATAVWEEPVNITSDLADDLQAKLPNLASDIAGDVYVVWGDGSGLLGSGDDHDIYLRRFTADPGQIPFVDLEAEVVNVNDIHLTWTPFDTSNIDHYLVYRSPDPRSFDFATPAYDTSNDVNPKRTDWTDKGAAGPSSPREYYYTVRAVGELGMKGPTSNTIGKWTRSFPEGLNTFSLPLEPLETHDVGWYASDIPNLEYMRWMDTDGSLMTYYGGTKAGGTEPVVMGKGYEVHLTTDTRYTFVGYPASMIRHRDGLGDSADFRGSLSAQLLGDDLFLTWKLVAGADKYMIYKSTTRSGLNSPYLQPVASVPSNQNGWTDSHATLYDQSYYLVVPVDSEGDPGSSTYSVGFFTIEYSAGSDTLALPLVPESTQTVDWFCDEIHNVVGMAYMVSGEWVFHAKQMPRGVYDVEILQGEGYQVSLSESATHTFVGY